MGDPGRLVAFEGVEGAGKSTQLDLLGRELAGRGPEVVVTRGPGGTPVGGRVRELLLDPAADMHPRTEALLFAAARAELVERVIRPALERGAVVLCDRYLDSSLAYQGGARGLGRHAVEQVNRFATGGILPDLVVLLDADPARFRVVDAAAPVPEVAATVRAAALALLEGSGEPQRGAPVGREGS